MDQLPLFLNVKGYRSLVGGGGTLAARKADLELEPGSSLDQLQAASIAYRIAIGPHAGRKALTLYSVPPVKEAPNNPLLARLQTPRPPSARSTSRLCPFAVRGFEARMDASEPRCPTELRRLPAPRSHKPRSASHPAWGQSA